MDAKVTMFDMNNTKVGKTFRRRAVQLVKAQRAEWTDEEQSSIRFTGDTVEIAVPIAEDDAEYETGKDSSYLYALAAEKLFARKLFIWHSIAVFPVFVFLVIVIDSLRWTVRADWGLMGVWSFVLGAWCMFYVIHLWQYVSKRVKGFNHVEREIRRARKIKDEVDRLKRAGIMG